MHPETPRSPTPNGLFTDDSSRATPDAGRSVKGTDPYRDTRESLLARRQALAKELSALDSRLEDREEAPPPSASPSSTELGDLAPIFFPRRAMSVVMAGVLAGVSVSSLLAYELGAGWNGSASEDRVVARSSPHVRAVLHDETRAERTLRRRKEGEALLMSSLFSSSSSDRTAPPTSHVRRLGPTTWEVDEGVLATAEPPYATLRLVPHLTRHGRVDGIRLLGLRPNGIHAQLGLRNGDVARRANGVLLTGADGAFAAVESMRRTHYLALELERDGEVITNHYLIATR